MSVFRVDKRRDFTVIANHVFKDHTLSAKAKGILVEMLSLPENWDYTLKGLATLFSDGIDSIRQGIRELEEHGYVVRERKRDARGRLGGMEYVIYETPHTVVENTSEVSVPVSTFPEKDIPAAENPTKDLSAEEMATQYNTNILRTNISSTYESNPNQSNCAADAPMDVMGYDEATERIRENIDYDIIVGQYPQERVDEIVDLAAEMLCSCRAVYKLGGDTSPRKLVQERLLRLDSEHIGYIIGCIDKHTGDVRNIKQYLMKTLINAPTTMGSYVAAKVGFHVFGNRKGG